MALQQLLVLRKLHLQVAEEAGQAEEVVVEDLLVVDLEQQLLVLLKLHLQVAEEVVVEDLLVLEEGLLQEVEDLDVLQQLKEIGKKKRKVLLGAESALEVENVLVEENVLEKEVDHKKAW